MAAPFRLARVLHLREQMRRQRAHEVEQLAARLAGTRAELARLAAERLEVGRIEAGHAAAGRLTPDTLHVGRLYDASLADAERRRTDEAGRLGAALAAARAALLHDRQEEEKYVRLAAAHRQRVLEEELRDAERHLDEIAIDRHRRRQKEPRHDAP